MTHAVSLRSVARTYGSATALDNVSFSVPEDSITGLLGRNGAGKTTIMSLISGQDRPTSGDVAVFGHDPFEHAPTLARISYVRDNQRYPDNYLLHHVLRIAPDFAPNWSSELAAELVEGFRLPAKTQIRKMSRGQLSAVAIVLGLASRASLTLLDEPYLGLDVSARSFFYDVLLRDYTRHPRTVLLSTHLVEESEQLFDRIVIVDRGKVSADCSRDDAAGLASVVSGVSERVLSICHGRDVLTEHAVGGLLSLTVAGEFDAADRSAAQALGIQISPASLQQLVAAQGSDLPRKTSSKAGAYS